MRPIVSIVGRPNVGKSTLFNKLVGSRVSITEDTPGVTRDRLYREAEWLGRTFLLMDTGGLEVNSDDLMQSEIEQQVDFALREASLVLFLVDVKDGVTPMDRMIATKIRKTGKSCLLVVNKVDSHATPPEVYEFYELGFDSLSIISAEQQYGLGDLLDEILDLLPENETTAEEEDALKIALIGKPNVGKSSLVNRLLGEERMIVTNIPGTTRDAIDSYYERDGRHYVLIDTAGLRRKSAVNSRIEAYSALRTLSSVDRADLCLFLIDAEHGPTEQDAKIAGYAHDQHKAAIIVVNKWDLVVKDTMTQKRMEDEIRTILSFNHYAPLITVSVKTGQRLDRLFKLIQEVDEHYSFRISTGLLNEVIRDAVVMAPPPTDKGKRLKIYYASQVATRPPKFIFYVNDADLFHFSYLRYLENTLRKNFDFTGVPLQLEVRERKEKA
ncbi:MAG: ribosome biogenesis GTPase Der [Peptoniphilaceae bacterium]|nr:ribosome biogenesis GTPase Der [Peptoniphilaceae bacterium]